jgi:uncharacterized protein (DUF58 family)
MFFPENSDLNKFEYSTYAAASIIELLKRQRDAVGITLFSENIELHTVVKSSIAHHRYLYSELEKNLVNYSLDKRKTSNPIAALHEIAELCSRRSLIVIFSDFMDNPARMDEFFQALNHLKHNKHEVVVFHVVQKKIEVNFELENRPYHLVDMETGEKMKIQPAEIKQKYVEEIGKYFNELKLKATNYKIDFVTADIDAGYDDLLLRYLLKRQKLH